MNTVTKVVIMISSSVILCQLVVMFSSPYIYAEAVVTCDQVDSTTESCLSYLQTEEDLNSPPSDSCCSSVQFLNSAATTTEDRQAGCRCFQSLVQTFPAIDGQKAAGLPVKCGVTVSFQISPHTDNCTQIP